MNSAWLIFKILKKNNGNIMNKYRIFQSIYNEQYCVFKLISKEKCTYEMINAFNSEDDAKTYVYYLNNIKDIKWIKCLDEWPPDSDIEIVIRKIDNDDIIFTPANEIYFEVGEDNAHEWEWQFRDVFDEMNENDI